MKPAPRGWKKPPTWNELSRKFYRNLFPDFVRALNPQRATPNADARQAKDVEK